VLVAFCASGCHRRLEAEIGSEKSPVVLVLHDSHVAGEHEQVQQLAAALGKEAGLAVRAYVARSSVEAIQVFGTRRADAGLLPLFEYLLARQEYGVQARLRVLRGDGQPSYRGDILVREGSGLAALAALDGKKLAYADPYSMSGFILPAKLLADHKVRPVPVFAGSHAQALEELRAGRVDAAATFAAESLPAGLVRLAATDAVPNEPLFFRRGVDEQVKQRLAEALERLAEAPAGGALLHAIAGIHGFAVVDDAAYSAVPEMIRLAGTQIEALVPGGWIVWQSNRSDVGP